MEEYHTRRYVNGGPRNDDLRLQREMFVKINGPPIIHAKALIHTIAKLMMGGVWKTYDLRPSLLRKFKFATNAYLTKYAPNCKSTVLQKYINDTVGRKGILEMYDD